MHPSTSPLDPYPLPAPPDLPTALIYTTDDEFFPPEWERFIAREVLHVDPIEMPGGHFPMMERPGELADLLGELAGFADRRIRRMPTYDLIRDLPLTIDNVSSDNLEQQASTDFLRRTTVVRLAGDGAEGVGEDVVYSADLHPPFQALLPTLPLAGEWTLDSFSQHVGDLELFDSAPEQGVYRAYRRWAMESAALDLALRQAGRSLAAVVGREPQPVRFVCSLNMGHPPSMAGLRARLAANPEIRFKLDATSDWDDAIFDELVCWAASTRSTSRAPTGAPWSTSRRTRCSTSGSPRPSPTPGWRIPT